MSLSGLYAVTSEAVCEDPQRLVSAVAAALAGGARLIQYRDKRASAEQREERAKRLQRLCHDAGAALIINDDTELALRSGADGVHLGASDGAIRNARLRLGPRAIIGRSCSGSLERAQAAAAEGASYVAFGRFFASKTKPDAPPASLELLDAARAALALPICVIGGLTADNAGPLRARGADLIAAVDGVFGAPDIEAAARGYLKLFKDPT